METKTTNQKEMKTIPAKEAGDFFGNIVSFNNSLKLYHWQVTGEASYAQHIAIDQALDSLLDATDRLVETTIAQAGEIDITVPQTVAPENIVNHVYGFYDYLEGKRSLFTEDFSVSIIDDYQEALQQLLYRLKRLK